MIQKTITLTLGLLLCVSSIYSKSPVDRDNTDSTSHSLWASAKNAVNATADAQHKAKEVVRRDNHAYSNATRAMLNAARSLEDVAEENLRCAQRKHDMATQVRENAEKEASMRFELVVVELPAN